MAGNSICTQKVLITLHEKRLPWDAVNLDLFNNEQYSPAYLKINPKGVVPSLVHDGKAVCESTLICEYLDEVFAQPRLMPSDPYDRARMRIWSKLIDEGIFESHARNQLLGDVSRKDERHDRRAAFRCAFATSVTPAGAHVPVDL